MKKVAIYARQSMERDNSASVETQIELCKSLFRGEDCTFTSYVDKGFSGKNLKRPAFEKMISQVQSGGVDVVASYRLDRISRSIKDFSNLLSMFEKYGVSFVSATENFDTATPIGRAMIYIIMVFAQLERETTALRISDNYSYRAKQKKFMGGNVPFGYKLAREGDESKIVVDEKNAEILKYIFSSFCCGSSVYHITHQVNKMQPYKPLTQNKVTRILKNISPVQNDILLYDYLFKNGYNVEEIKGEFNAKNGVLIYFKTDYGNDKRQERLPQDQLVVMGEYPPLIPSREYIMASKLLNSNVHKENKKPSQKTFLAGLVSCKECGKSFGVKHTQKGSKEYAYYYCRGRLNGGTTTCNNEIWINSKEFEQNIISSVENHLKSYQPTQKDGKKTKLISEKTNKVNKLILEIDNEINNLVAGIGKGNSVVDDVLSGKITALIRSRNEHLSLLEQLEEERTHSQKQPPTAKDIKDMADTLNFFLTETIEDKTHIIRRLIKQIHVDKQGKLTITYNF